MKAPDNIKRIDRRRFIVKLKNYTASMTVIGATINVTVGCSKSKDSRVQKAGAFSTSDNQVQPVPGTRPELTPLEDHYKMVHFSVPQVSDLSSWRLTINGLVDTPIKWSMNDIKSFEAISEYVTLTCVTNPVGGPLTSTTKWTGVSMQQILPHWNLKSQATHLRILGADGFFETVAIDTIHSEKLVMLVYEWNGKPLPPVHGYPLRILIPNRFGMKQPKWIESIEAIDHWEPGYSVKNTWDKDAIMKLTSVIDAVYIDDKDSANEGIVQIGGIAHAGSRGISKVEIQIDDDPWQSAQLRKPLSDLSWTIWRFDWLFEKGDHTFKVRCYDKKGNLQAQEETPSYPDGATGWHKRTENLG